jgi:hypothetical protein
MRIEHRAHFLGVAAGIMRRVLVDHARRRQSLKRGGANHIRAIDDGLEISVDLPVDLRIDLMALDQALARRKRSTKTVPSRRGPGYGFERRILGRRITCRRGPSGDTPQSTPNRRVVVRAAGD